MLIFLISTVIITTLLLQYHFSKDLAFKATNDKFKEMSEKIDLKVKSLDKRNNDIISTFEIFDEIKITPEKDLRHPLLALFTTTLKNNTHIYALYTGNKNGDFYEVINLDIDESLRKKYKVSKQIKWLVVKIYKEKNQRIKYEEFLDEELNQLKSSRHVASYNPSLRPWFKEALKSDIIIKTKPYMYTNLEAKGITYAKAIENTNLVFGIDVSLKSMNNYLKKQSLSNIDQIFLFKKGGEISSYVNFKNKKNDISVMPYSEITKKAKINLKKHNFMMKIDNQDYFVHISQIKSIYKVKDYLAILTPVDTIIQPYLDKIYSSFFITILILTFTIPLIYYSTRVLVIPVQALMKENDKISKRDFDNVSHVNTRIKEFKELSISLVQMANSIKSYQEKQKELMDSFIKLIASAIDAKSKYTGGHCERVPILTNLLANAASESKGSIFKDFELKTKEEKRELNIAAWLHDCGKVTTPEYVVDKATKLETIYNRIHEIRTRFEVIYRDKTIEMYKNILNGANQEEEKDKLQKEYIKLQEEFKKIADANIGGEFMKDEDIEEIKNIASRTWIKYFDDTIGLSKEEEQRLSKNKEFEPKQEKLLDDKNEHIIKREHFNHEEYNKYKFKIDVPKDLYNLGEVYNLTIKKGTLTKEERFKINEHMIMSIIMLEQLPFPNNLKKVPEYAGAHHETLIGTGYPRKLTKKDMSIPARIMAIADIFEALTASDRPYKEAKTLSQSIKILSFMVKDKHIDEDIFKLFLTSGVYKEYAEKFLKEEQIDEVDISLYIKS
ncbi:HD domain-containing phosphohydrolase [Arcobacter roscoffensis]|uniref:Amino acid ABC transporter n=1 Tax=Arcobacter roscoffensis TaxID=2961520 RepID=A0ABY5E173_9BACT|nr:HD domain-containing phosphohydrolase [Arcobacter roscoffensis]UTJ05941.1 amino acid ABC transporter [Arcobacter roscoffensis]